MDVEGKKVGIDARLLNLLSSSPKPMTYAGGVRPLDDLNLACTLGNIMADDTAGSALDIFGGDICYADAVECLQRCFVLVAPLLSSLRFCLRCRKLIHIFFHRLIAVGFMGRPWSKQKMRKIRSTLL